MSYVYKLMFEYFVIRMTSLRWSVLVHTRVCTATVAGSCRSPVHTSWQQYKYSSTSPPSLWMYYYPSPSNSSTLPLNLPTMNSARTISYFMLLYSDGNTMLLYSDRNLKDSNCSLCRNFSDCSCGQVSKSCFVLILVAKTIILKFKL